MLNPEVLAHPSLRPNAHGVINIAVDIRKYFGFNNFRNFRLAGAK